MTIARNNVLDGYELRDTDYPNKKAIYYQNTEIGHIIFNERDGVYLGRINEFTSREQTYQRAYDAVRAQRHNMSMGEIARYSARPKGKFPVVTELMIDFLQKNAAENNGRLRYSNDDMALWLGHEDEKTRRPLGNWMSRLDFACYLADLPSVGQAAAEPYRDAFSFSGSQHWDYPREIMRRAAKAHLWADGDFEKLRHEARRLRSGSGHDLWQDEETKRLSDLERWALGVASGKQVG